MVGRCFFLCPEYERHTNVLRYSGCMAKMTARTIRVEDEIWEQATHVAQNLGISVSDLVRQALTRATGNYAGTTYSGASTAIMGGAIVLSDSWKDADPELHRFHMAGCEIELRGIDLWVSPLLGYNPGAPVIANHLDKPASIVGCYFKTSTATK